MQASPRGERKFPPRCISPNRKTVISALFWSIAAALCIPGTVSAAPPGAPIDNQAVVSYANAAGVPSVALSNEVQLVTAVIRSSSSLAFTRVVNSGDFRESVGPAYCEQAGNFVLLPDPVAAGVRIDPTLVQEVSPTSGYNLGETLFLRLDDADQNVDYTVIDTALVTVENGANGDAETIRLSETGPNTGVFAGYLPSSAAAPSAGDCVLQGTMGAQVRLSYSDPADPADSAFALAGLDPIGVVFDSQTGAAVDGVTVQLIDVQSGLPATVFGNDGVSVFPGAIVSGSSVTDSGGTTYAFTNGQFRFPTVPAGSYRLEVTPPGNFAGPSIIPEADLQLLPNAPFLLGPESFGSVFNYDGNGPFAFDFPVDPQESTLFLRKSTTTTIAAPGDFVRYELLVENTSTTDTAMAVRIADRLPPGTRFVAGTATRDGAEIDDPAIGAATRLLEFSLGNLASGADATIAYVIEIVGGAKDDELVNLATAQAEGGIVSNESVARIRLGEDLFRSTSTLIGRVVEGSCARQSFEEDRGVAGVRVYLEDGRYAVSDEGGRFHFEGLAPGTHVAQLDTATIADYFEITGCADQARFAGSPDSQFVHLSRGSLQRADFYLRRKLAPEGRVHISLDSSGSDSSDKVSYEVGLNGTGNIPVANLRALLVLPEGMNYLAGSMRVDGAPFARPRVMGQSLTVELGAEDGGWTKSLTFDAVIDNTVSGDLVTRAIARFDTPVEENQQTPVAETLLRREAATWENEGYVLNLQFGVLSDELSPNDQLELDALIDNWQGVKDIRITAIGHSDSTKIAVRNRDRFADNYVLSKARATAAASYLAKALQVSAGDIQVEGRGPDDPIASNGSVEGRALNRRVEVILGGQRPGKKSFLKVTQASSGTLIAETRGLPPGVAEATRQMLDDQALSDHLTPPQELEAHVNSHAPGIGWVLPDADFLPAVPALKISIKHGLEQTVSLFVNGLEVSPLNFEGTEINTERTVAVSRWVGVDLLEGTNQIVADVIAANGLVADRLTREVHYSGAAVRGEFVGESSVLLADGKSRPLVAVRLYDRFGKPARHSSVGAFSVDAPYRSWWAVQNDRENKLVHVGNREPLYTVGDDGIAFIELEPTTQSGLATVRLKLANQREQELGVWLKPQPRDWILVGFGEGTVGYNTLNKNVVAAEQAGQDDGYYDDGRVAFFAKGQIKGEYLLTLAYDSARDRDVARRRFQTEVDPNEYYTLYADNTEQRFEAPSQRKVYVKLERNQFVALFGDYSTGLSTTELARYERRFNGLKSEFHGERAGYSMFAAETDQAFVRDELQGDGTSGLYRLSTAPIIGNSETIRLEVRDRFDSALILSTQSLSRFLDYNLDPFDGTLYFKKPVPSRDRDFNPIYIVAEYETTGDVDDDLVAGGRLAAYNADKTLEVGLTHVTEERQAESGDLSAVDLRWQVNEQTQIRAEYAETAVDDNGTERNGEAQTLSVEHRSDKLDFRASYKEVDQDFGLGQQVAAEKGIRKYTVDGRYEFTSEVAFKGQATLQENLETGTERTLAEADLEYQGDHTTASIGLTHAEDEFVDGVTQTSNVVNAGISRRLFDSALTARANGSFGLGDDPENADYLSSFVFGFDYSVLPEVDVFVEYENAEGRDVESEMTRIGVRATPWSRAQFNSSLTNEMSEFGPRLFANLGLVQGFQINEQWVVDVGFDQTRTVRDPNLRTFDPDRELAFGSLRDDFSAGYVGALYQAELWSMNSRLEYRDSASEKRASLLSGWYRQPRLGHGMSASLSVYRSDRDDSSEATAVELRYGWAYRPADSRWALLNRVDLQYENLTTASNDERTWRVVNNLNANRRINANTQLALQYAFKYIHSDFGSADVSGYTDLIGVDYSRGFAGRWEAGVHTSLYHSYRSNVLDYGVGVDLGYNLTDSMWLSVGYNFAGFHDGDFAAARYTAEGPYLTLTVRAHQELLKRLTGR